MKFRGSKTQAPSQGAAPSQDHFFAKNNLGLEWGLDVLKFLWYNYQKSLRLYHEVLNPRSILHIFFNEKIYVESSSPLRGGLSPSWNPKLNQKIFLAWYTERIHKISSTSLLAILFTLLIQLQSCEEFTTWDLDLDAEKQLVVEAILTDENTTQEIRLSQSFNELNGEALPVEDAIVYVEANGVIYPFSPMASDPGLYLSENPFAIRRNLTYSLNINWQGKLYDASSKLSSVGPIPTISFFEDSNTDSLQLAEIGGLFNLNEQAMYEVNISWDHLTNVAPTEARLFFYAFNSLHISEFIRPQKAKVVFPKGSIVEVRKFGLNDDFAAYLRALAIETEWNGSVFYGQSDNLPTNISNEGLGFFSTCAVIMETVVAE